jgi:hypothetical protein
MRLSYCGKITAIVILMSFWTRFPVSGVPPMEQAPISGNEEMILYSDSEIDLLIEELTVAAQEAIEKAAGAAARAAALASLEREAAAIAEAAHVRIEAQNWEAAYSGEKTAAIRKMIIAGALCFAGGFAVGILAGNKEGEK